MGEVSRDTEIQVVRGAPWKDAVITLLQPRSPYRPWRGAGGAIEPGADVVAILDTDPASVIAAVRTVGPDGRPERALASCVDTNNLSADRPPLLELSTLMALTGASVERDRDGAKVFVPRRLEELMAAGVTVSGRLPYLRGHTTLAAARILLHSDGRCSGCASELDLAGAYARYHVHVHTVDFDPSAPWIPVAYDPPVEESEIDPREMEYGPVAIRIGPRRWRPIATPPDWPAVLCDSCHDRMRGGGFTSFLDFRFSLDPPCPSCSGRWTMGTYGGYMAKPSREPWLWDTGCTGDARWCCGACGHKWGNRSERGAG